MYFSSPGFSLCREKISSLGLIQPLDPTANLQEMQRNVLNYIGLQSSRSSHWEILETPQDKQHSFFNKQIIGKLSDGRDLEMKKDLKDPFTKRQN